MSITTRDGSRVRAGERPDDDPRPMPGIVARLRAPSTRRRAGAGARAAAEAALLGWLFAVVPVIAAYAATAALPALGDATWTDAAAVGAAIWRLALGAPTDAGDGAWVSLVPVGLTAFLAIMLTWTLRRARVSSWSGGAGAVAGYTAGSAVLALVAPVGARQPLAVVAGACLVGTIGTLIALGRRSQGFPPLGARVRSALDRLPELVRTLAPTVARGAGYALGLLLAIGAVLAVVSLSSSTAGFAAVLDGLRVDRVSTVVATVASLALLPTFAVWGIAWLAGPGFAVGSGTLFSPDEVVSGALPVVPALAALPAEGTAAADLPWAPLLLVAVGGVVGWWLHRHLPRAGAGRGVLGAAVTAVLTAVVAAAAVGLLARASSGSVGPGRMAQVGPDAAAVAVAVAVELTIGALVVVVLAHRDVRAWAGRLLGRARRRGELLGSGVRARVGRPADGWSAVPDPGDTGDGLVGGDDLGRAEDRAPRAEGSPRG